MAVIHIETQGVQSRLAMLGLEEDSLRVAVAQGQLAVDNCTSNHPRMYPPLAGWAGTVRGMRDYVNLLGWENSDDNNYARSLDPTGQFAIAVATGNDGTGLVGGLPTTKASKGRSTVEAVLINQAQFDLFPELKQQAEESAASKRQEDDNRATWILLIHRAAGETRAELSLPVAIGPDGRVSEWRERIILRAIPRDPAKLTIVEPPVLPDLDVQVTRRA